MNEATKKLEENTIKGKVYEIREEEIYIAINILRGVERLVMTKYHLSIAISDKR